MCAKTIGVRHDRGGDGPSPRGTAELRRLLGTPLRAHLVRLIHGAPEQAFPFATLLATVGRLPLDVEHCLRDLVTGGLIGVEGDVYRATAPADPGDAAALRRFLAETPQASVEDDSTAARAIRDLLGSDEKMLVVFESIRLAAKTMLPVLVLGPTGSGKEMVARAVHELGPRRSRRFQAVNCAALPDSLFESELFGFERGAFTGASHAKVGRMELADGGTLLLDEIGDMSLFAQAKLLRVLEDREFERLGGTRPVRADFRLIAATNRPLWELVGAQRFREDLYYRINAYTIRLPALRDRATDIPQIARRLLQRYCVTHDLPADAVRLSASAEARLMAHAWPGNIRELESAVGRAAMHAPDGLVDDDDFAFLGGGGQARAGAPVVRLPPLTGTTLREVERAHIRRILEECGWNKKAAAVALGIGRNTLYRKITELDLQPAAGAIDVVNA